MIPSLPYGLTPGGFVAKPLAKIREDIEAGLRQATARPDGTEVLNTKVGAAAALVGVVSAPVRELWELAESVYAARTREGASGASLDDVNAITGSTRDEATRSTVIQTLNLDPAVVVPAGSVVSMVGSPSIRFRTRLEVDSTAGGGGPYTVQMEAEETGPIAAPAGSLTVIESPVAGWTSTTNAADATLGAARELDAAYRARGESELATAGTAPLDAIRADLLEVDGVVSVSVFQNVTEAIDVNGLPPHSVEAIVYDGTSDGSVVTDEVIAEALFAAVGGGIATHGTTTVNVTDDTGEVHAVSFSRPTERLVYVSATLSVAPVRGWAASSQAEAEAALVSFGRAAFLVGDDVVRFRWLSSLFGSRGLIDVTSFTLGFSASPVGTANLVIGARELAAFDTSRVVLTINEISPP